MIVLTMRTDKPEAEIGLFDGDSQLVYDKWEAHRELSRTIHQRLEHLLSSQHKTWKDLAGIVVFEGPGSFTGLRIGMSVANALAYGLHLPIVATQGNDWIIKGVTRLEAGEQDAVALPFYGSDANITAPRS